jgi:hypothetical protein
MILASTVKLCCIDDLWVGSNSVLSTNSELAVNHVHWQFQHQLWNFVVLCWRSLSWQRLYFHQWFLS